jgi:hypothetical protein
MYNSTRVPLEQTDAPDLLSLRRRAATVARLALPLLIIIASFVDFVPFAPGFPTNNIDSAWEFSMNVALEKGMVFGRDIIFTFGPYASIFTGQYHPATDTQMLWSSCLLASAFAAMLLCLSQGTSRLVALGLAVFLVLALRDAQMLAFPFISLLFICRVAMPAGDTAKIALNKSVLATLALMTVALSLLPLIKGTFAIASGIVLILGCGLLFARGFRTLAIAGALLFFCAIAALWCVAGQPLIWLPRFFLAQLPVVSGYAPAMSTQDIVWEIVFFVGCCLLLGLLSAWSLRRAGLAGVVLFLGSAAILFVAFKEGFVRDDGHRFIAGSMLAVAGLAMMLGRKGIVPLTGLIIGLTGWAIIDYTGLGLTNDMLNTRDMGLATSIVVKDVTKPFARAGKGFALRLIYPTKFQEKYADDVIAVQGGQPIPKLAGPTDVYSFGQSAVFANGLDWAPRPLVQSYTAYTPWLEQQDADHLTGSEAPTNILFTPEPIDDRLAALEDGTSWPILLTRYEISGYVEDWAVLTKRPSTEAADPVATHPTLSGTFHLGQQIPIPQDTLMVWAKIDVQPTFLGKLVTFLFKPPPLSISYSFQDGSTQTFRYVAGLGVSGFVAAPVVMNTKDFICLTLPDAAAHFAGRRPVSLSITADQGEVSLWRATFDASFAEMQIPVQPDAVNLFFDPLPSGKVAGYAPLVPGTVVAQRFTPPHKIDLMHVSVVTWGHTPDHYTINWRIDDISNNNPHELGSGTLDAHNLTDWQGVELPFAANKTTTGPVKVTFWTDASHNPVHPAGIPFFFPRSGGNDPPAEINGSQVAGGAQFNLTPYFVR